MDEAAESASDAEPQAREVAVAADGRGSRIGPRGARSRRGAAGADAPTLASWYREVVPAGLGGRHTVIGHLGLTLPGIAGRVDTVLLAAIEDMLRETTVPGTDRPGCLLRDGRRLAFLLPAQDGEAALAVLRPLRRRIARLLAPSATPPRLALLSPRAPGQSPLAWAAATLERIDLRLAGPAAIADDRPTRPPAWRRGESGGLLAALRRALAGDGFRLYQQVIAPLDPDGAGEACFEVLLRLQGPDGTLLGPAAFLPVAARHGLLGAVDRWVVSTSLAWMARHQGRLRGQGRLAVNLSGDAVGDPAMLGFLLQEIARSKVAPARLTFEITETQAIPDLAQAARLVGALRRLGCHVALDDFGIGFSSLARLRALPIDLVKVDGSFVRGMHANPRDHALVQAIQEMSRAVGVRTVAEYVENADILAAARTLGMHFAQGFGIARPSPIEELLGH